MDPVHVLLKNDGYLIGSCVHKILEERKDYENFKLECCINADNLLNLTTEFYKADYIFNILEIDRDTNFTNVYVGLIPIKNKDKKVIYLDIICSQDPKTDIEAVDIEMDFECNALIMHGLEMSISVAKNVAKFTTKEQILDDIVNKRAKKIGHYPTSIKLMMQDGWTIIEKEKHIKYDNVYIANNVDNAIESCIICLGSTQGMHVKRTCCNARYHTSCYNKMITAASSCPMCRTCF